MTALFKLVLPSSGHLSPDSLFAVLFSSDGDSTISVGQAATTTTSFWVPRESITDVAFFDGKLYAISRSNKLFVLDIDSSDEGQPRIQSMKRIAGCISNESQSFPKSKSYNYTCWRYLAESGGRLLQIRRLTRVPSTVRGCERSRRPCTVSFDVFEADLTNPCGQWRPVNTLGGQALFVGTHSKSLPASECGAQEDCIYFLSDYDWGYYDKDPFRDCGVFNMRNGMITPMSPKIAAMQTQGNKTVCQEQVSWASMEKKTECQGRPAWFFHAEAM